MPADTDEMILNGCPICRGIAIGKPFILNRTEFAILEVTVPPDHAEQEIERYYAALLRSKQDIKRLQKQLEAESALEGVSILEAQLEILQDPLMTKEIECEIRKTHKNAEFVFQQMLLKLQERFSSLKDPFFIERFKDLQDLSRRILGYLHESGSFSLKDVPPHSIVCAQELTALDAAEAQIFHVGAFITESGGATSHAAIVAKAKGIPYITHVNLAEIRGNPDYLLIVDGRMGKIIINPTEATLLKYEQLQKNIHFQTKDFEKSTYWPAQTYDGYTVRLYANLETTHEIDLVHQLGGQGIGLFRSEYIFLPKNEIPSEEEQFQIYYHIVDQMKGLPVVIRTFDFGGDKTFLHPSFSLEQHPSLLGGRATRFLLKEKQIFKTQLRAILRASVYGTVSILFPMIATLSDLKEAKAILQEVRQELNLHHPVRIGCMIEVPSAALMVEYLVEECDFLSIGTNDLVQYSLAIDRAHQTHGEFDEPTDPSIIRFIKLITMEADKAKVPVSVCGEMASDPRFASLLLGLGIQELSVAPRYLPLIKNAIRSTSIVEAVGLAEQAVELPTAQDVLQLVIGDYRKNVPHDLCYNAP